LTLSIDFVRMSPSCSSLLMNSTLIRSDVVTVRVGDDEIVDVDLNHQLHVAVLSDVDDVF
jgi:hypothetical protein